MTAWHIVNEDDLPFVEIEDENGEGVAGGVHISNAPLIATAPRMLAALKRVEQWANKLPLEDWLECRAAILAAEGKGGTEP